MLKNLEQHLKRKAKYFKSIIKKLPITDYKIEAEIRIYLKNGFFAVNVYINFKDEHYLLIPNLIKEYDNSEEIKEINYTFTVILQKSFYIKEINEEFFYDCTWNNNCKDFIKAFKKYKKIFEAIENDLIKLHKKVGGKKRFDVYEKDCDIRKIIKFNKKKEKHIQFTKHLKGTFLMKKIEKIYGEYFFRDSYEILSEVIIEEKETIEFN